ncbi:MAG TPA: hypothetical protein VNT25_07175 [Allosphingosinicella sp.]|nr:hypothetical protein [Allosphingosinicella sp.]
MIRILKHVVLGLAALVTLSVSSAAAAAVQISFYSRELGGNNFPHAFVTLKGRPDAGGAEIDTAYGFTAKAISPAVLMGSVGGAVLNEPRSYIEKSDRQFSLMLTDAQYAAVMQTVDQWKNKPQPSYNLNRANCVHFVAEVAQAIGLRVPDRKELMKKPRSFLLAVKAENPQLATSAAE